MGRGKGLPTVAPLADLCVSQQSAERPALVASDRFIKANLELNMPSRMTLYPAVSAAHAMESIIGSASRTRSTFRRYGAIATESSRAKPEQPFHRCVPATLSLGCPLPRRCLPYLQGKIRGIDPVREAIFTVWCSQRVHFELIVSVRLQMAKTARGQMVPRDSTGLMLMLRWKRLSGSYSAFIPASRASLSVP